MLCAVTQVSFGNRWGYPIALAFAANLILIFVAQLATPTTVVITTLGLVPIVAAAWLLSTPLAIGVPVLGIGLIGVAGGGGGGVAVFSAPPRAASARDSLPHASPPPALVVALTRPA